VGEARMTDKEIKQIREVLWHVTCECNSDDSVTLDVGCLLRLLTVLDELKAARKAAWMLAGIVSIETRIKPDEFFGQNDKCTQDCWYEWSLAQARKEE